MVVTPQERWQGEGHVDEETSIRSWWRQKKEAEAQRRKDRAFEASWENLIKAFASPRYHKPRPLRSPEEQLVIRRFVLRWWINPDPNKPSGRKWARDLGIDHAWLLRLVRRFETDPAEVARLQAFGDPTLAQLNRARECTRRMRERGELRNPRQRVPPLPPAFVESVRRRFAEGWSKSRLRSELLLDLDRKRAKKILEKVCSDVELVRQHRAAASIWWTRKQREWWTRKQRDVTA
jgi:hypothetical protein